MMLTVNEAANLVGVTPATVRHWLRTKQLKGYRLGERGRYRIDETDLRKFYKPNK